jgi:hypothetical protein
VLNANAIEGLNVFISYSRPDMGFVDELVTGLQFAGAVVTIDRHSIREGEDWKARLSGLIAAADTVVFVLSPDSAKSSICGWEVSEAVTLGKRILPILWRPLNGVPPPAKLTDINYVRFDEGRSFMTGLIALINALGTNLEWLRDHTQLLSRAIDWERGGRSENRLMSGEDIAQAKTLIANRPRNGPDITPLQLDFIRASEAAEIARNDAIRGQIEERSRLLKEAEAAAAQRAEALSEAETALKLTAQLRRRQNLGAAFAIVIMSAVGLWAYGVIGAQRAVKAEAARTDITGQIVSYATSPDAETNMTVDYEKSYADAVSKELCRPNKNVVEALISAHKQMNGISSQERPILSNSMNGFIYLTRQPASRRKRAILVAVDDTAIAAAASNKAPQHDVDAMASGLRAAGFASNEVQVLHNPDRAEIRAALETAGYALAGKPHDGTIDTIVKGQISAGAPLSSAPPNTMLLFFFSGPGVEVDGEDYLIPRVGPDGLNNPESVVRQTLAVPHLTERFDELAAASVVILDTHFTQLFPQGSH